MFFVLSSRGFGKKKVFKTQLFSVAPCCNTSQKKTCTSTVWVPPAEKDARIGLADTSVAGNIVPVLYQECVLLQFRPK